MNQALLIAPFIESWNKSMHYRKSVSSMLNKSVSWSIHNVRTKTRSRCKTGDITSSVSRSEKTDRSWSESRSRNTIT
jgi:hypothetical protein